MKIGLDFLQEPATDEQISDMEATLGYKLPEDYKYFLKVIGAASIDYREDENIRVISQGGDAPDFSVMYLLGISPKNRDWDAIKRTDPGPWGDFAHWMITVAYDGEFAVMDLRPKHLGKVYIRALDWPDNKNPIFEPEEFLRHDANTGGLEFEDLLEMYSEEVKKYWFLSNSFTEFLALSGIDIEALPEILAESKEYLKKTDGI